MLHLPLLYQSIKIRNYNAQQQVFDPIRKRWLLMTPEEHVRQRLLAYMIVVLQYPPALIAVEKSLTIDHVKRRFDIVVYSRQLHQPWLLAECKAPDVPVTDAALQQLLHYHNRLQCSYWLLSNGHQHFCADARNQQAVQWIDSLPAYDL